MLENNWHKKEEPFLSMSGLGGGAFQQVLASSAVAKTYSDDVFSTFVYTGNNDGNSGNGEETQTITNNIDLSGEGGLVWLKKRVSGGNDQHFLYDTARGATKYIRTESTAAEATGTDGLTQFNSNGFLLGGERNNYNSDTYVSWTFRKCPKFFDIVTYAGDGTNGRAISHNLDGNPKLLLIKKTSDTSNWAAAYIAGASLWTGDSYTGMYLNDNQGRGSTTSNGLGVSAVSSSTFTVNNSGTSTTLEFVPNSNGSNYVAYLFAEDDAFGDGGDEQICNVSTYSGSGSAGKEVNVGFEPQWLLIKRYDSGTDNWMMFDNMRGVVTGGTDQILLANSTLHEDNLSFNALKFTSTGFTLEDNDTTVNASGASYWYMAIRRPHKPPTAATEVFNTTYATGFPRHAAGFAPDSVFQLQTDGGSGVYNRVLGAEALRTNNANATFSSSWTWDRHMTGSGPNYTSNTVFAWSFKRAAGFFDVVTYTGNSTNFRDVSHNLSVTPEMIIVKDTTTGYDWMVWHKNFSSAADSYANLNLDSAVGASTDMWGDGGHTSTTFEVGLQNAVNKSGDTLIAYLFASRPGISKVGSYSGTGNNIDVDCGFSSGARFVLVKRTDSSGNWYCWDTLRGIASGNDVYSLWDTAAAQTTNTDYIDPLNAGFTITSSAPAALNTNGGTYIFLAIA